MITGLRSLFPIAVSSIAELVVQPPPTRGGLWNRALNFSAFFFSFFTQYSVKNNISAVISSCFYIWESNTRGKRKKMRLLPAELMKTEVTIKASPWNISSRSRNILLPRSHHWVKAGREAEKGDTTSQADVKLLFPLSHGGGDGWVASDPTSSSPVFFVHTLFSCSLCYLIWIKKKKKKKIRSEKCY